MAGKPGRRWKNPKPCGTDAAYKRHLYHREVPCDACHRAHRAYDDAQEYRRQLRAVRRQARIEADLQQVIAVLAAAMLEEEAA